MFHTIKFKSTVVFCGELTYSLLRGKLAEPAAVFNYYENRGDLEFPQGQSMLIQC